MKATVTKAAILAGLGAAMFGSSAMAASPISYSYAELGFQTANVDDNVGKCWSDCYGSQENRGFNLKGSFEIVPHLFAHAGYEKSTSDQQNKSNWTQEGTWTEYFLGVGGSMDVSATNSAYATLDYNKIYWNMFGRNGTNFAQWENYDSDEDFWSVTVGDRSKITDGLEFDASVSYGTHNYQKLELGLVNNITSHLSIKAAYAVEAVDMDSVYYSAYYTGAYNYTDNSYSATKFSLSARYTF